MRTSVLHERTFAVKAQGHQVGNVEFLARSSDTPRFNLALITLQPHREGPELHTHATAAA